MEKHYHTHKHEKHVDGCEHCHNIEKEILNNDVEKHKKEKEELKKLRLRIGISFITFILAIIFPITQNNLEIIKVILFLLSYFIIGWDVIKKAIKNIVHGQFLDENFLMTIATIGAFVTQEYPEAVMVMLLYKVGVYFQQYAVGKSRKSISDLMNIKPEYANLERNGKIEEVKPEEVKPGDVIVIKPGEKVPLDGVVVDGESYIDTIALTGESVPKKIKVGEEIFNGCINQSNLLKVQVTKKYEESTVAKILELVEHASERKAKTENFISKFAKYYTPFVVIAALLLACVPPLIIEGANWLDYIHRACSFLVISCPCALVISIPLGFFGGIGGASKLGILLKGSNYIEILGKVKTIVVDKTGTLTTGTFKVTKIEAKKTTKEELLEITALAETFSEHPIAISIQNAYGKELDEMRVNDAKEIAGNGIAVKVDDKQIYVGNYGLMKKMNIHAEKVENEIGTIVYVARENEYLGYILISDEIKEETKRTIMKLKKENVIKQIIMLTGDNLKVAEHVAKDIGIDAVYAELLPGDKVEKMEEIMKKTSKNDKVAFVGDGINDAPVLTRADIGIAMGAMGADAAIEAADVVIMDDNFFKVYELIRIAKRTLNIVKQNIVFALLVKLIVLALGALGIATMWVAVFADVGVSVIAIINSLRAMKVENTENKTLEG